MTKHLERDINNCVECPFTHEGGSDHPCNNAHLVCEELGNMALWGYEEEGIHPKCPLPDLQAEKVFGLKSLGNGRYLFTKPSKIIGVRSEPFIRSVGDGVYKIPKSARMSGIEKPRE